MNAKKEIEAEVIDDKHAKDLARLTVITTRGEITAFCLGPHTVLQYGEKKFFDKGVLKFPWTCLGEKQFSIDFDRKKWTLQCFDFANQTFLNQKKIQNNTPVELHNGDLIRIQDKGKNLCFFFEDHFDEDIKWSAIYTSKRRDLTVFSSEALRQMSSPNVKRKDRELYPHAKFERNGRKWFIKDVNIGRDIAINNVEVKDTSEVNKFDLVQIGTSHYLYLGNKFVYDKKSMQRKNLIVSIDNRSIGDGLFKKKVILKDIGFTIEPGELVLLLGGSGAGKTTLINAITGYEKANAKIINAGVDVYENYNQMKYSIAVVPQQDLLRETDTVYNTLYDYAKLRMSNEYSITEKKKHVTETLEEFALIKNKRSLVKNLSGGQRKRLSIACEYIGDPDLFILDEPDSGLDGVIAKELIERLRKIADSGKIVIVISHTPDRIIEFFDHIIVLAKDSNNVGRLAFYGTIDEARKFFDRKKMEDIVKIINPKDAGGEDRADEVIERYAVERKEREKNNE